MGCAASSSPKPLDSADGSAQPAPDVPPAGCEIRQRNSNDPNVADDAMDNSAADVSDNGRDVSCNPQNLVVDLNAASVPPAVGPHSSSCNTTATAQRKTPRWAQTPTPAAAFKTILSKGEGADAVDLRRSSDDGPQSSRALPSQHARQPTLPPVLSHYPSPRSRQNSTNSYVSLTSSLPEHAVSIVEPQATHLTDVRRRQRSSSTGTRSRGNPHHYPCATLQGDQEGDGGLNPCDHQALHPMLIGNEEGSGEWKPQNFAPSFALTLASPVTLSATLCGAIAKSDVCSDATATATPAGGGNDPPQALEPSIEDSGMYLQSLDAQTPLLMETREHPHYTFAVSTALNGSVEYGDSAAMMIRPPTHPAGAATAQNAHHRRRSSVASGSSGRYLGADVLGSCPMLISQEYSSVSSGGGSVASAAMLVR